MLRRDFVRSLMALGLLPKTLFSQQAANPVPPPPAPVPWTLGLNPTTPLPATETGDEIAEDERSFFTPEQKATLTRLCELLLPAMGDKPGALEAGTPGFLDFLIGKSSEARKQLYRSGLDWLNAEAKGKYQRSFVDLDAQQADILIRPWLRTWLSDHPPTEPHADFVNIAHADIRTATMNSKTWNDANLAAGQDWVTGGLYWYPIEPDMAGLGATSTHLSPHGIAMPETPHSMPSYPR